MSDNYIEFAFAVKPLQPTTDILIAELGALGFESFVETQAGLLAYIRRGDYHENVLDTVQILSNSEFNIEYTQKEVKQENWNARWEQDFEPIKIGKSCWVRAPFHPTQAGITYDIVIEPKMSFGTGHHETTYLMLRYLLEFDLTGKSLLDMGTGTGVLAILASMKGALKVDAIDIDPWSYRNTKENILSNKQKQINVYEGDVYMLKDQKYDFILANINRNILLEDIPCYAQHLNQKGHLVLSGFYTEDLSQISGKCAAVKLNFKEKKEKNNWVAAVYRKV